MVIATGQNNLAMNRTVLQIAKEFRERHRCLRGRAQLRRSRHPQLRSVPELLHARARRDADGRADRRQRRHARRRGAPRPMRIGYGSVLRGDDAVGRRAAEAVAARDLPGVRVLSVPQLVPELAVDLAGCRSAIFVDASVVDDTVQVRRLAPVSPASRLTHSVAPQSLLALAADLETAPRRGGGGDDPGVAVRPAHDAVGGDGRGHVRGRRTHRGLVPRPAVTSRGGVDPMGSEARADIAAQAFARREGPGVPRRRPPPRCPAPPCPPAAGLAALSCDHPDV